MLIRSSPLFTDTNDPTSSNPPRSTRCESPPCRPPTKRVRATTNSSKRSKTPASRPSPSLMVPCAQPLAMDKWQQTRESSSPGPGDRTTSGLCTRAHALISYGNPLITFDPVAVRKLRWKLDFYTVPTVSLLYLFCFIDRANIGKSCVVASSRPKTRFCFLFISSSWFPKGSLTRSGNARIAGLEDDLELEGFDYNVILSVFYIS